MIRDMSGVDLQFVDDYRRMRVDAAAKAHYTETIVVRQVVSFALSRDLLPADPLKGLRLKKPKPTRQPSGPKDATRRRSRAERGDSNPRWGFTPTPL